MSIFQTDEQKIVRVNPIHSIHLRTHLILLQYTLVRIPDHDIVSINADKVIAHFH
jgi:hypothetical protein